MLTLSGLCTCRSASLSGPTSSFCSVAASQNGESFLCKYFEREKDPFLCMQGRGSGKRTEISLLFEKPLPPQTFLLRDVRLERSVAGAGIDPPCEESRLQACFSCLLCNFQPGLIVYLSVLKHFIQTLPGSSSKLILLLT